MNKLASNPNPKNLIDYKASCHQLCEELFGADKKGKKKAYKYLKSRFNRTIHFSKINDKDELRNIFNVLWIKSFREAKKYSKFR